jgi:hypothetical protein
MHGDPPARTITFVPHPGVPASRYPWTFCALIEIESQEKKTDAMLQSMVSELHARHEASHAATGEDALAEVCRRFNDNANLLTRKNQAWYKRLHMALAIVDGEKVSLALYGNVRAYLAHRGKLIDIQKTVQPESGKNARGQFKIFTSLLAGNMAAGDRLLLSCAHLFDYFSVERIFSILSEKSAFEAAQHLTRMLKGLPGSVSVSAVIAESFQEKPADPAAARLKSPNQSMAELNSLQSRTSQLLTGSFVKNVQRFAEQLRTPSPPVPSPSAAPAAPRPAATGERRHHAWADSLRAQATVRIRHATHALGVRMRALAKALIPARKAHDAATASTIVSTSPVPPPAWRVALERVYARFRRLPRSSQYLFIGALLLALLFIESIVSIANQRISTREREAFAGGAVTVEQALNESEASLIYGDEEKARRSLLDAAAALASLRPASREQTDVHAGLQARLENLRTQVFHVRVIDKPEGLLNLAQFLDGGSILSPGGLIGPSGEFILSFSTQGSTIFIIQPQSRAVTVATPDAPDALTLIRGTAGDNSLFYFVTTQGFARFNARERVYAPLATTASSADIADLAVFGSRLYTLNRATGAIMRQDFTENGLNPPAAWLAAGTAVPGATAMAIDGSIYVADAGGVIRKYTRGVIQDFAVGTLEPPLNTPSRLAVDNNFLYILDPTEKRIIILNKDGTLKEQITSPAFDRLIDFVPNASRKLLYVLNGTVIYEIPFPQ